MQREELIDHDGCPSFDLYRTAGDPDLRVSARSWGRVASPIKRPEFEGARNKAFRGASPPSLSMFEVR